VSWVIRSGHSFGREERLLTFVMFAVIVLGWMGVRQGIAEAAFNDRVATQRAQLALASRTLSYQIAGLLARRHEHAPPVPRPATWEADEAAIIGFEADTIRLYERSLGPQVRVAHDLLTLRGLRDRDLDAFYRAPANNFQMRVIADKLTFLAGKLDQGK
jgi:hypothetical protein